MQEKPYFRTRYTVETISELTGKDKQYIINRCSNKYKVRNFENLIKVGKDILKKL